MAKKPKKDGHGGTTLVTLLVDPYKDNFEKGIKGFGKDVMKYMSRNSSILSLQGPQKRLIFKTSDMNILFENFDIEKKTVINAIKETKYIDDNWHKFKDPFNVLSAMIIHYFSRFPKKRNELKIVTLYLIVRIYTSLLYRQLKYEPDSDVVAYTLDHLTNRYLFKKYDTLYEVLDYLAESQIRDGIIFEKLQTGEDHNIVDFLNNIYSRVGSVLKNFVDEFMKDHAKGNRSGTDKMSSTNSEGDEYMNEISNISSNIEGISRRIKLMMSRDSGVDSKLLNIAIRKVGELSLKKMMITIDKIRTDDDVLLYKLIVNIIGFYLTKSGKSITHIKSPDFLTTMIKSYSASKTNNEFMIRIKENLKLLLEKYSDVFVKTSRVSTKSKMLSCLFLYLVLYIQKNVD